MQRCLSLDHTARNSASSYAAEVTSSDADWALAELAEVCHSSAIWHIPVSTAVVATYATLLASKFHTKCPKPKVQRSITAA